MGGNPDTPFLWTSECEEAFNSLKVKLTIAPVLGYPDYSLPFVLQTDASGGRARCCYGTSAEWN